MKLNKYSVSFVILLGLLTSFAPLATDTYLVSFPDIAASLNTNVDLVQLTLSIFFLGMAIGQLIYGPLTDRFGRKYPLLIGLVVFIASSILIIFSPNIYFMIAMRLLQAIGGCVGMVVTRAIISDLYDMKHAARVLSLMMVVQGVAPIIAPVIGGYIQNFWGWQMIFVFLTLFATLCLILTFSLLPETLVKEKRIKQNMADVFIVFYRLIKRPQFILPTLAGGFAGASMFAFISGSPFVFMGIYGVSELQYGWLFGLCASGMIVASQINRQSVRRCALNNLLLVLTLILICVSLLLMITIATHSGFILFFVLTMCVVSCTPPIYANSVAIAMSKCGGNAGSASSLVGVVQFGLASIISGLVSFFHDDTAYPMVFVMLFCGVMGCMLVLINNKLSNSDVT